MNAVLISIQPKYCKLIADGKKTIEVRKTKPNLQMPFKFYIYCAKATFDITDIQDLSTDSVRKTADGRGKVIGEFVCDRIDEYKYRLTTYEETPYKGKYISKEELSKTCLSIGEINDYLNGKNGYFWHISDLKIYDKPKELGEFYSIPKSGSDCCIGCIYHECRTCTSERKYLYRPPQSWCYVEELE